MMAYVYWIHLHDHTDVMSEGYVGITTKEVNVRFKHHVQNAKREYRLPIHKAIVDNDCVITTLLIGSVEYCRLIERKLRPEPYIGWNTSVGGDMGRLGIRHTVEARVKMSKAAIGKIVSAETRKKQSLARKGKPRVLSEEMWEVVKYKASQQRHSEETRKKLSDNAKKQCSRWRNPIACGIWKYAIPLHNLFLSGEGTKTSAAKQAGFSTDHIKSMWRHFENGWNPELDQEYLLWLSEQEND